MQLVKKSNHVYRRHPQLSVVRCPRPSIYTPLTPQLTLSWHSIDISVDSLSTVDQFLIDAYESVNAQSAIVRLLLVECWPSIDQEVHRVPIEGIDGHLTADAFSTSDPKSSFPVVYKLNLSHGSKLAKPRIFFYHPKMDCKIMVLYVCCNFWYGGQLKSKQCGNFHLQTQQDRQ